MAHVVSVPKREPCQKCSLPIFLAERLTVGKKIYHRTCLKCARCKSQLTLGSFYETEIDDEYCCETCPDEEKSLNDKGANNKNNFKLNENNCGNKIAERLAFFENRGNNDSKRLLQKSLSDEEKSQSLKKFEENHTNFLQLNATLNNNFSNSNYSLASASTTTKPITTKKSSLTTSSSEDTEDDSFQIKNLNLELSLQNQQQLFNKNLNLLHESSKKLELLSNKQKNDTNNEEEEEEEENEEEEDNAWNTTTIAPSKLKTNNEEANNDEQINKEQKIFTNLRNTGNITHNIKNNTKDCTDNHNNDDDDDDDNTDNNEKINISSIVRARLEHFQTKQTIENSNNINNKINSINDNEFMEQQNLISMSINNEEGDIKNNYEKNKVPESNDNDQILQLQQEDKNLTNSSSNENNVSYFDTDENFIKIEKENEDVEEEEEEEEKQNEASNLNEEISKETNESHKIELSKENEQNEINHPIASSSNIDLSLKINDDDNNDKKDTNITNNDNYDKDYVDSSLKNKSSLTLKKIPLSNEFKNSNITKRSTIAAFGRNIKLNEYPEELNPFASDEDDENHKINESAKKEKRKSLNPFDSDDSENDVTNKNLNSTKLSPKQSSTPKVSTNPFGSENEDEDETNQSLSTSIKRTPVPTPRHYVSKSQNPTPEVTPRKIRQSYDGIPLKYNNTDYHNSSATLSSINSNLKTNYEDNFRGSTQSLSIHGSGSETRRKIKKAPAPPPPIILKRTKELFPTSESDSKKSSPSSSNAPSPKFRKKRIAPAPPVKNDVSSLASSQQSEETSIKSYEQSQDSEISIKLPTINVNIPEIQKLSDEEKAFLENSSTFIDVQSSTKLESPDSSILTSSDGSSIETIPKMRLIAFDHSILEDSSSSQDFKLKEEEEENVVYRRKIIPSAIDTPTREGNSTNSFVDTDKSHAEESHDRQLEKLKDNKEAKNRNRQSQVSIGTEDGDHLLNKSIQGKWKRRKGPAPALPVPPRKVLQMLPLQEIRHELEVIEVQQQGLEKQGVMLEKMIRDRCEGQNSEEGNNPNVNSKEVEDLILQLFELVNEKNELFRRQAELMYLRRQHRLEQEQADLEYEIRVLMAQPECNKTDSDKSREESLIARLVEVVQLRNEVIECLEMDRVREAEEDKSIKQRLEMHTAKRDEELSKQTPTKLSKKEKKKQKELKKLVKCKKLDDDKDADESEISLEKQKLRKKKKKFLF